MRVCLLCVCACVLFLLTVLRGQPVLDHIHHGVRDLCVFVCVCACCTCITISSDNQWHFICTQSKHSPHARASRRCRAADCSQPLSSLFPCVSDSHQQPLVHEVLGLCACRCAVLHLLTQDVAHGDVDQVVLRLMSDTERERERLVLEPICARMCARVLCAYVRACVASTYLGGLLEPHPSHLSHPTHTHPVHDLFALGALSGCRGTADHDLEGDGCHSLERTPAGRPVCV